MINWSLSVSGFRMKHNSHYGCLVLLIPLTFITASCLAGVVWMIGYCIVFEHEELFPPTANIGLGRLILAVVLNVPTALLWYAFSVMKNENEKLNRTGAFNKEPS